MADEDAKPIEEQLTEEHGPPVKDHMETGEENVCGYCGKPFAGVESRIEREVHGRKWAFCSDECLANFKDASDYQDPDPDMTIEPEDTGFEMNVKFSGPQIDEDE